MFVNHNKAEANFSYTESYVVYKTSTEPFPVQVWNSGDEETLNCHRWMYFSFCESSVIHCQPVHSCPSIFHPVFAGCTLTLLCEGMDVGLHNVLFQHWHGACTTVTCHKVLIFYGLIIKNKFVQYYIRLKVYFVVRCLCMTCSLCMHKEPQSFSIHLTNKAGLAVVVW